MTTKKDPTLLESLAELGDALRHSRKDRGTEVLPQWQVVVDFGNNVSNKCFGPFERYDLAEQCLVALAGRADVLNAKICDWP